jgi:hypothetical protein
LLGSDYDGSPYTQSGNLVAELAVRGIRLVIEEFRADVTKTLNYPDCPVMPTLFGSVGVWPLVGGAGGGPVGISRSWWRLRIRNAVGPRIRTTLKTPRSVRSAIHSAPRCSSWNETRTEPRLSPAGASTTCCWITPTAVMPAP